MKTVFVIGAGASEEVGLPTGSALTKQIADSLAPIGSYDPQKHSTETKIFIEALQKKAPAEMNKCINAAIRIRSALPLSISIDNLISQLDDEKITLIGKFSIVRSILKAEQRSQLMLKDQISDSYSTVIKNMPQSWYQSFFKLLTEQCKAGDLEARLASITLIVFNYDRCIEHFLFHAFRALHGFSAGKAADLVNSISIFHPYGTVGRLPWSNKEGVDLDYGSIPSPEELVGAAELIRTFTEGTNEISSEIMSIRHNVDSADKLVFLGFGFHSMNMDLIYSGDIQSSKVTCYASVFNVSQNSQNAIHQRIQRNYSSPVDVNMSNLKCNDFFSEYWHSLSFDQGWN